MPKPFHKRKLNEWYEALCSKDGSQSLIQELTKTCGIRTLESHFVYRCRINIDPNNISEEQFDSPPAKKQNKAFNRFQPLKINCLYGSSLEETALLETLPSIIEMDDIIYSAGLKILKPLKMLNLMIDILFKSGSNETEWNYKPIFSHLFLNDDPTGLTKTLKITQLLSQKIFENKIDGIIYLSKCNFMAHAKKGGLSSSANYLIYGSPIREKKLGFNPNSINKFKIEQIGINKFG